MTWQPSQHAWLADGRLHLHHGPIDLIICAEGSNRARAYRAAITEFEPLLANLTCELKDLRAPTSSQCGVKDPVARRMHAATKPYLPAFITPMAAVAGAVADTILEAMLKATDLDRAYVNNGGDISLHLKSGQALNIAAEGSLIAINFTDTVRGIATSGWRGRSLSLGIADAVTVLAKDAATADAAATMLGNQVDLVGHPAITRIIANDQAPDSDLGELLVTHNVGPLSDDEITLACQPAIEFAEKLIQYNRIEAASIKLQDRVTTLGSMFKRVNTPHAHKHIPASV